MGMRSDPLDMLLVRPYPVFGLCGEEITMTGSILIVSSLDTKGQEIRFLKTLIEQRGHKILLLDMSMRGEPQIPADIPCEEVARDDGTTIPDCGMQSSTRI